MDSRQTAMNSSPSNYDKNDSKEDFYDLGNFASELLCSKSQAADYAHEIDDTLHSLGLPTGTVSEGNDANKDNTFAKENHPRIENDRISSPPSSFFPATVASILQSKSSHSSSNGNLSTTVTAKQIVSFSHALDTLLGGGVALSELTEIVGLPGVGKTQLAMQLCVDARLPGKYGGVEGCAVVIDSEGSWSGAMGGGGGERCWAMAVALVEHVKASALRKLEARREREACDVSEEEYASLVPSWFTPESILEGIHIFRVHDEASQTCTLYSLPQFLMEQEKMGTPVKLVVIDSLAFHYRVAASSSSSNSQKKSFSATHNLTRMAAFLTELASEFDLAVVALNHLTTKIERNDDDTGGDGGGVTKLVPALGESWAHSVTSRLMIDLYRHTCANSSVDTEEVRTCTLVKSPHKPPGTALFVITDKGIRGVPPEILQTLTLKRARLSY